MRSKHFFKNALIFVPIMYSFNLTDLDLLLAVTVCFAGLCLAASGIYAVNDIADYEKDREHPKNKTRPVAAGLISKPAAAGFALLLFLAGFGVIALFGGVLALVFAAAYVLLNLAYSFKLKHFAVIDCFCIAAGFVLRIYIGGAVIGEIGYTIISEWLFLTVTAVSLFMAFGKRRGELIHAGGTNAARKVLGGYNLEFLNGIIFSCAGASIVFYALWAVTSVPLMIYTVPMVIFIVCRYLQKACDSYGDPVTVILGDKLLICAIAVFGAVSIVFLYGV
jgi:4-hydroxybenzoate polyprenyltransferase